MTRIARLISLLGPIVMVVAGCARRDGEADELRRGALIPGDLTMAVVTGSVTWAGQPVEGLASQTLMVFVEGEAFASIDPATGIFTSPPVVTAGNGGPGNEIVSVNSLICSMSTRAAVESVAVLGGFTSTVDLDI